MLPSKPPDCGRDARLSDYFFFFFFFLTFQLSVAGARSGDDAVVAARPPAVLREGPLAIRSAHG
jgi:hypothetical protein